MDNNNLGTIITCKVNALYGKGDTLTFIRSAHSEDEAMDLCTVGANSLSNRYGELLYLEKCNDGYSIELGGFVVEGVLYQYGDEADHMYFHSLEDYERYENNKAYETVIFYKNGNRINKSTCKQNFKKYTKWVSDYCGVTHEYETLFNDFVNNHKDGYAMSLTTDSGIAYSKDVYSIKSIFTSKNVASVIDRSKWDKALYTILKICKEDREFAKKVFINMDDCGYNNETDEFSVTVDYAKEAEKQKYIEEKADCE